MHVCRYNLVGLLLFCLLLEMMRCEFECCDQRSSKLRTTPKAWLLLVPDKPLKSKSFLWPAAQPQMKMMMTMTMWRLAYLQFVVTMRILMIKGISIMIGSQKVANGKTEVKAKS